MPGPPSTNFNRLTPGTANVIEGGAANQIGEAITWLVNTKYVGFLISETKAGRTISLPPLAQALTVYISSIRSTPGWYNVKTYNGVTSYNSSANASGNMAGTISATENAVLVNISDPQIAHTLQAGPIQAQYFGIDPATGSFGFAVSVRTPYMRVLTSINTSTTGSNGYSSISYNMSNSYWPTEVVATNKTPTDRNLSPSLSNIVAAATEGDAQFTSTTNALLKNTNELFNEGVCGS